MRILKRDLTHYFLREHDQLPQGYLRSCKKFFDGLKLKQDSSRKLQASSRKLDKIKDL